MYSLCLCLSLWEREREGERERRKKGACLNKSHNHQINPTSDRKTQRGQSLPLQGSHWSRSPIPTPHPPLPFLFVILAQNPCNQSAAMLGLSHGFDFTGHTPAAVSLKLSGPFSSLKTHSGQVHKASKVKILASIFMSANIILILPFNCP